MADDPVKTYHRDLPVHGGPYNPATDTVIGVKSGQDYQFPMKKLDNGRSRTTPVPIVSGNVHIDYSLTDYFSIDLDDDVDTWSFEAMPDALTAATLAIVIRQGPTPKLLVWPATFLWTGDEPLITMEANAVDLVIITSFDGGTTWLADLARNYKPAAG